jgi:glutamate dehydrogenase/leucine dehydrogenase
VFLTAREAAKSMGLALEGARVAVQGFGNVGSIAAELMSQAHARVVAVQDHSGSLGNAAGIDVTSLIRHVQETGGIAGFAEAEAMDEEAFWGVDCDVMIPAALEGQVDGPRAQRIRARLLVEGANGPVNREADQILLERGVTVVPDVIANAGRRGRLLLRMGAGLFQLLLVGGRDQPAIGGDPTGRVQGDPATRARAESASAHGRLRHRLPAGTAGS